jgi:hypothetical protein
MICAECATENSPRYVKGMCWNCYRKERRAGLKEGPKFTQDGIPISGGDKIIKFKNTVGAYAFCEFIGNTKHRTTSEVLGDIYFTQEIGKLAWRHDFHDFVSQVLSCEHLHLAMHQIGEHFANVDLDAMKLHTWDTTEESIIDYHGVNIGRLGWE